MAVMDSRIKKLKCSGCKVEVAPHQLDTTFDTCNRIHDKAFQERMGPCPLKQMVEFMERMEEKKEGKPRELQIPRLLDMKALPASSHNKKEIPCYVCGNMVKEGESHDCHNKDKTLGTVHDVSYFNTLAEQLLSCSMSSACSGAGKVVKVNDNDFELEVENPLHIVIDKKGARTTYEIK